ncbi:MAG: hypothetical protein IJN34_08845, partial [Clostridia bacterium]|nr:hypothetical protein [Clostridia bacterium]
MGRDCEAPPEADEASRLAAAATRQLPSERRLAKEMPMLQRATVQSPLSHHQSQSVLPLVRVFFYFLQKNVIIRHLLSILGIEGG